MDSCLRLNSAWWHGEQSEWTRTVIACLCWNTHTHTHNNLSSSPTRPQLMHPLLGPLHRKPLKSTNPPLHLLPPLKQDQWGVCVKTIRQQRITNLKAADIIVKTVCRNSCVYVWLCLRNCVSVAAAAASIIKTNLIRPQIPFRHF